MLKIKHRGISFLIVTLVYALATAVGIVAFSLLSAPFWLSLLLADVLATVAVFLFSLLFGNASVYDPYWSVQPPVILAAVAIGRGGRLGVTDILLLLAVFYWGIRLTVNWAYTFRGLTHQDWRYTMLAEKTGKAYPLINFLGIHMFPTVVVYSCILPAVYALYEGGRSNIITVLGFLLSVLAATLQLVADIEMQAFRNSKQGGFIGNGLWKYARHPNYLGEILMWWGVALMALSVMPERWYLALGALLNTLMFLIVSIPMADRRQAKKDGYAAYRERTRALLPIPKH